MSNDRLTGSDRRALLLWLVLAVVGTLFAWKNYFAAFPEAAVNFQVSRAEALGRARSFVSGLGEDVSGYQSFRPCKCRYARACHSADSGCL